MMQSIDNIIYNLEQLKQELQGLEYHIQALDCQTNHELHEMKEEIKKLIMIEEK